MAMDEKHDTIFDAESNETEIAHVDFDLLETTGRWLLKVVSGPNTGAEFSMQTGTSYLIGTDTTTCDIVFHDLSVSRQHARLSIDPQNHIIVEDLSSRNGTFVEGEKITQKRPLTANALVTMGTTTFMLIDREGERKTIVSPPLGAASKSESGQAVTTTGQERGAEGAPGAAMGAIHQAVMAPIQTEVERIKEEEKRRERHASALSALMILAAITGLFVLIGIATTMLFHTEKVVQTKETDADALIAKALKDYSTVRYSYNPANGHVLLIGHVLTQVDRSKIVDNLSQLKFITAVDSSNIVIDEYVWREINQVLAKNPDWKSINISSPVAGKFIMTGFLKTAKQADELSEYISSNFPYLDLLETKVVVEEYLKSQIMQKLNENGFRNVQLAVNNGELTFTGAISANTMPKFNELMATFKAIPGVRAVQTFVTEAASDQNVINLTDRYQVSGYSTLGKTVNVVINGKILTVGDSIDGMTITQITPHAVFLEKEGFKYKIDFNR